MNGNTRRQNLLNILTESNKVISASKLADAFHVSRQVIVNDIALLRANGAKITATNRGYLISEHKKHTRVFKNISTEENSREEYNLVVDYGGMIKDVFVYHKVYGVVRVELHLKSRLEIDHYMKALKNGNSSSLQNITSGYHYITVEAKSEEVLDLIQQALNDAGFLAQLQDYEPIDFWANKVKED